MKERPILFSTEMVRAILEGRKTQTRRIVKNNLIINADIDKNDKNYMYIEDEYGDSRHITDYCPHGKVGDRLWVRESFKITGREVSDFDGVAEILYKDNSTKRMYGLVEKENGIDENEQAYRYSKKNGWNPAIFMPRWASRIDLEITNIRVERLQDISEEDALKEGVFNDEHRPEKYNKNNSYMCPNCLGTGLYTSYSNGGANFDTDCKECNTNKKKFKNLWDSINTKRGYGWDINPLVWVEEFKVI